MKTEISLKRVRKSIWNNTFYSLLFGFGLFGVLSIVAILIASMLHYDVQKPIWPLVLLSIAFVGGIVCVPVISLISRNSKKVQIKYVRGMITWATNYAKVLRGYTEEYAKNAVAASEVYFKKINADFGDKVESIDTQFELFEKEVLEDLKASWEKVKKIIDETDDKDAKDDLKESYRDHKADMLADLQNIRKLLEKGKYYTTEVFQQKIENVLVNRERLVEQKKKENERLAKEYETLANEWVLFLKHNF